MSGSKLLIDTNVFIGLEDAVEVDSGLAELVRKCSAHGVRVFIHERALEDIRQDKDENRRRVSLSKAQKFESLASTIQPAREQLVRRFGAIGRRNDEVDVALLHALEQGAVDLLITEDRGIHDRARRAGLSRQVASVADALAWVRQTFDPKSVALPYIAELAAHQIDPADEIFASLRSDYVEFDVWWREKCIKQHRPCWVAYVGDEVAGIVVRKDETRAEARIQTPGTKVLKLCTFKVKPRFRGEKLGEHLLKQALWYAQRNSYDAVYLTTFPQQQTLIRLLEYFGFRHSSTAEDGELLFEKSFSREPLHATNDSPLFELVRANYPRCVFAPPAKAFCVPIQGDYHQRLFPEIAKATALPLLETEPPVLAVRGERKPGNTIRKVYLCRAQTEAVAAGDVLLFYMSKSQGMFASQAITTIGVVENWTATSSFEELVRSTAKRSVFSEEELEALLHDRDAPLKVIDFLLIGHLERPVFLEELLATGVLAGGAPQSICSVQFGSLGSLVNGAELGFRLA